MNRSTCLVDSPGKTGAANPAAQPADAAPPYSCRILVVDDCDINRRLIGRVLTGHGHDVAIARSADEAVAACGNSQFDIVLMDLQMPERDGLAAAVEIREHDAEAGKRTPIIGMSAHAHRGAAERCLAGGMDEIVSKPIQPDEIDEKIHAVLTRLDVKPPVAHPQPEPEQETVDEAAFDREQAMLMVDGSLDLLVELANQFLDDAPGMMLQIRAAIAGGDAETVHRVAHTLKGSAGVFGAEPTYLSARALECLGRDGELRQAPEAARTLGEQLDRLCDQLSELVRS